MTNDEIEKLAREYAEEIYPHEEFEDIGQMNFLRNTAKKNAADFMRFLLRTHCIVSKEEVRKLHTAELDLALFYTRRANSCCNNTCRSAYEGYKDAALSRASLLESLFDAETFKNSEV